MTWCSENSTVPGFFLASSAIHCRFVDRFAGFMSPPVFPANGLSSRRLPFLLRVPASPVPRSQRYYEGATTSHPRIYGRLLVRSRSPHDPPAFVFAAALPQGRRSPPGRGVGVSRLPVVPAISRVDANGISQVFRRSIPCLCSVPRPRSNRRALATHGHVGVAPATHTAKASAMADFGANPQLRHLLSYASRVALPHTCKARFRLVGWPWPGGSRTLWIASKGFSSLGRSSSFPALLTIMGFAPLNPSYGIR